MHRGFVIAREIEPECRANARFAVDADMPAGLLDEAEHHAQAQPGATAGRLGRIEWLENVLDYLRRHS